MGEGNPCSLKNSGEISPGEVLQISPYVPIGVENFATYDKIYRKGVCWSGKSSAGNLFSSSFLWKTENPPSSYRSSKYVAGKEIWAGITEYCDISKG